VLDAYGVNYEQLGEQEKSAIDLAVTEMNRDAHGNAITADSIPPSKAGVPASKLARAKKGKITSKIKGEKVTVVAIAALAGKGYPLPVDYNNGLAPAKKAK